MHGVDSYSTQTALISPLIQSPFKFKYIHLGTILDLNLRLPFVM